jgi:hypothetical protein
MPVAGVWSGTAWGSYSGTLALDLRSDAQQVVGEMIFSELGIGQTRAKLVGNISSDGRLEVDLQSFTSNIPPDQYDLPSRGKISGRYHAEQDFIEGTWTTDRATSGKFALIRRLSEAPAIPPPVSVQAIQRPNRVPPLHNRTDTLGSYRFDQEDLAGLAEVVCGSTRVLSPAINIVSEGRGFIHVGADSVLQDKTLPDVVYDAFISANEGIINAGHKLVAVTFKKNGPNTLFVSDYDRTWVEGKASEVVEFLRGRESKAARFLGKYGPVINSIIFLVLLGVLPSIHSLLHRFYVLAATFALLFTLLYSWRLAVSFKAYLRDKKLPWFRRYENVWLTLVSLLLTALITYLIARFTSH